MTDTTSHAGGAGGLNSSGAASRIGFQLGMVTLPGLSPTHMHGPVGTVPVQKNGPPFTMPLSSPR
jgi:hypothetical protein